MQCEAGFIGCVIGIERLRRFTHGSMTVAGLRLEVRSSNSSSNEGSEYTE